MFTSKEAILGTGITREAMDRIMDKRGKAPYSSLADSEDKISYHGAVFELDYEHNTISLGDMSNPNHILSIPLTERGHLLVNRDSVDDLLNVIDMFSPQDSTKIISAIYQDNKNRGIQQQIEEDTSVINLGQPSPEKPAETA